MSATNSSQREMSTGAVVAIFGLAVVGLVAATAAAVDNIDQVRRIAVEVMTTVGFWTWVVLYVVSGLVAIYALLKLTERARPKGIHRVSLITSASVCAVCLTAVCGFYVQAVTAGIQMGVYQMAAVWGVSLTAMVAFGTSVTAAWAESWLRRR